MRNKIYSYILSYPFLPKTTFAVIPSFSIIKYYRFFFFYWAIPTTINLYLPIHKTKTHIISHSPIAIASLFWQGFVCVHCLHFSPFCLKLTSVRLLPQSCHSFDNQWLHLAKSSDQFSHSSYLTYQQYGAHLVTSTILKLCLYFQNPILSWFFYITASSHISDL